MTGRENGEPGFAFRVTLAVLLVAIAAGLGMALLQGPLAPGLAAVVDEQLDHSGVENPVTAVLLNFRGYDTLLEIAVLTAALVGVWALQPRSKAVIRAPSPVLVGLTSILTPLIPVVCAYLLWAGASRPGGAFQAGAVLASLGVLLILSGRWQLRSPDLGFRWGAISGLATFLAVAVGSMAVGGLFLEYPPAWAGGLILLVEAFATVSIAVILTGLFLGGAPADGS